MAPELFKDPREKLVRDLEAAGHDPHGSIVLLERTLKIDMLSRLDFKEEITPKDEAAIRAQPLSIAQYEGLKGFEAVVKAFLSHGTYKPRQLGLWFETTNTYLRNHGYQNSMPLDVLFAGYSESGLNKDNLRKVCEAALPLAEPGSDWDVVTRELVED